MFLPFEFIKYYLVAKGRHGIHSPFAYNFSDKCLQIKLDENLLVKLKSIYSNIQKNNEKILVNDKGSGSKKLFKSRKVKDIFKVSSSKGKYANLLYRISNYYKPTRILELGTSLGIGTIHLKLGNPMAHVTTIEGCNNTMEIARKHFELAETTIDSICNTFENYLKLIQNEKFDLVYIDGHHDGEALKNYISLLASFTHNDTIFVLDDIRWSNSMFNAWQELIKSDEFHVSIDIFRMGIVIPRKQQIKQHFVLKI